MPMCCVVAQRAEKRAAGHAVADHVQCGQFARVEQDFNYSSTGCGVQAHGFLLGAAGYEDGWLLLFLNGFFLRATFGAQKSRLVIAAQIAECVTVA